MIRGEQMAIHGPLYWKGKAEELKEINNNLVEELSTTKDKRFTAERKMYDLERENFRKDDKLSNMRTIGWRIKEYKALIALARIRFADVLNGTEKTEVEP